MNKQEVYLQKVYKINPHLKIISEYKGLKKPITYICPICNESVTIKRPSNLYGKHIYGCRSCFMKKLGEEKSQQLQKELIDIVASANDVRILEFYKRDDGRLKLDLECSTCGHKWSNLGKTLKANSRNWKGCPRCWSKSTERKELLGKSRKEYNKLQREITSERLDEWISDNNMTLVFKPDKMTTESRVVVMCNDCGYKYKTGVNNILMGRNDCAGCKGTRITTQTFKQKLEDGKRYDLEVLGEYTVATEKIELRCTICEYIWEALPHQVLSGSGCPRCNSSSGERYISFLLDDLNIEYEKEKLFDDCKATRRMPFDFYLPKYDICIEYDGEQHFKPVIFGVSEGVCSEFRAKKDFILRQKRDRIKDNFCKDNYIVLIRIPYYMAEEDIEGVILTEINRRQELVV